MGSRVGPMKGKQKRLKWKESGMLRVTNQKVIDPQRSRNLPKFAGDLSHWESRFKQLVEPSIFFFFSFFIRSPCDLPVQHTTLLRALPSRQSVFEEEACRGDY